ncbi:hypothetical protein UPYG_G00081860 [Umbra pygmaea]|uniref:Uncharacterized protein n=1 Tax=Umbra pygmaea TaxID=75934 RepID=A0ABD0XDU9_UMBPY
MNNKTVGESAATTSWAFPDSLHWRRRDHTSLGQCNAVATSAKSSKVVVYFCLPKRWHQSNILACVKLSRLPRRSASKLATRNSRRSVSLIGEEASGLGRGRGVGNSPSPTPSSDSAGLPVPPQRGLPKRYPQLTTSSQTLQTPNTINTEP